MVEKFKPPKVGGTPPVIVAPDFPTAYRRLIQDRCQYMDIDKLREKSDVIQVKLPEIFVPLYTNDPKKDVDEQPDLSDRPSAERGTAVDIEDLVTDDDDLVAEGLPGCGKTTLIKHIAYQMI